MSDLEVRSEYIKKEKVFLTLIFTIVYIFSFGFLFLILWLIGVILSNYLIIILLLYNIPVSLVFFIGLLCGIGYLMEREEIKKRSELLEVV